MPTPISIDSAPPAQTDGAVDLGALHERFAPMLKGLAARALPPALTARLDPADVVQETFAAALKRLDYLAAHPEVPVYFKLRTILFQTLTDLERPCRWTAACCSRRYGSSQFHFRRK